MGTPSSGAPTGVVLRARTSVLVGVALLVLVVVLLTDALLRGRWNVAVLSLPALGLLACVAVEVFLRPSIRVHPDGITVVNPLVTTEIPWAAVADVRTHFLVAVDTRGGQRIRCWGAPTASRSSPASMRSSVSTRGDSRGWLRASSPHRVIESFVAQYGDLSEARGRDRSAAQPHRNWHAVTAFVAVVLVLVAAGQVLVGG